MGWSRFATIMNELAYGRPAGRANDYGQDRVVAGPERSDEARCFRVKVSDAGAGASFLCADSHDPPRKTLGQSCDRGGQPSPSWARPRGAASGKETGGAIKKPQHFAAALIAPPGLEPGLS